MQYFLNGVRSGNPERAEAVEADATASDRVDVLIVGCGPAGLTLATQLSQFSDIRVKIIDRKMGPLKYGQADGIACRSMEMFQAFGFAEKVAKEGYWVNEVAFWRPDQSTTICRAERIQDVEDDLSEMPHVILSQARVHDFFLEKMAMGARRLKPDYECELVALSRGEQSVTAKLMGQGGEIQKVQADYVVGCDGARSTVRSSLGFELKGEAARQLWGVMDVLCVTDFPDIRLKCAIQSAEQGSLLIIPREGGYMVRMYIELDELQGNERAADRGVTIEDLIAKAQAIFAPYGLTVKEVGWWSAYEIGQRVCDRFDDDREAPRIFIAGDACHTHSPKAGQGMNVSMADAFNLGWKLAAVIRGRAHSRLLQTYSEERRSKAKELIDFDRDMARLFSEKPRSGKGAKKFQRYFAKHSRYTAGVETCYDPSLIVQNDDFQDLAKGLKIGMRFHSCPVIRVADAKPMELGHCIAADGRWRLMAFVGEEDSRCKEVRALCSFLQSDPRSPLRFQTKGSDLDHLIDLRAIFQIPYRKLCLEEMPKMLLPNKGKYGLIDYEKIFCADVSPRGRDIFEQRKIDRQRGALVLVRPDQFIADVMPIDETARLAESFDRFLDAEGDEPS